MTKTFLLLVVPTAIYCNQHHPWQTLHLFNNVFMDIMKKVELTMVRFSKTVTNLRQYLILLFLSLRTDYCITVTMGEENHTFEFFTIRISVRLSDRSIVIYTEQKEFRQKLFLVGFELQIISLVL